MQMHAGRDMPSSSASALAHTDSRGPGSSQDCGMEEEEARKVAAQQGAKGSGSKKKKKKKAGEANGGSIEVLGDGAGQESEATPPPIASPQESLSSAMQRVTIVDDPPEEEPSPKKQLLVAELPGGNGWDENQWDAEVPAWQGGEPGLAPARSEEPGWEVAASRRGRKGKAAPPASSNAGSGRGGVPSGGLLGGRRPGAANVAGGNKGGGRSQGGQGNRGGRQGNSSNNGQKSNGFGKSGTQDGEWGDRLGGSRPNRAAEGGKSLKLDGWGNPIPEADCPRPPPLPRGGNARGHQQHERGQVPAWQLEAQAPPPPPTGWNIDPEPGILVPPADAGNRSFHSQSQGGGGVAAKGSSSSSSGRYQSSRSYESNGPSSSAAGTTADEYPVSVLSDSQCSDDDYNDDSDYVSGDSDSEDDAFQTTHKWFQPFFEALKNLSGDQMSEHDRQWHCPACRNGVGAIDWYRGLQPLLTHAQTIRAKRVKLHRKFAKLLEDELRQRGAGTSAAVAGKFGKWKGLRDTDDSVNPIVLWPPMIVVQNTQLELDEQDKWVGMGNPELLDHFKEYNPLKARHAYGPQGHRGMSIVMFADSPAGYYDAQRLDRAFTAARRSRDDWYRPSKSIFEPGGQRILYGYMASKEDIDLFNKHGRGKMLVKCELKRLNEAVLQPMRKQDEETQQVNLWRDKVQKAQEHSKELEKTVHVITRKLRLREEEIKEIQRRALEQDEKNKREVDDLEKFYQDKVEMYEVNRSAQDQEERKLRDAYDKNIQLCQQLESQASQLEGTEHQQQQRKLEEEIARQSQMVEVGLKRAEAYEAKKNEMQQQHHLRKLAMKQQQYEQSLALEKQLQTERGQILDEYKTESMKILSQIGGYGRRDGLV